MPLKARVNYAENADIKMYVVKKIRGREYLYKQFRVGKKVVTEYIGPCEKLEELARIHLKNSKTGAGAGIRTRAGLRQRSLSPPPLT